MEKPKLTIAMIVKNEEKNLQRCLDSFLPIINMKDDTTLQPLVELIIIDTGSTDRTVNVAKKFTDKVFIKEFVPWSFADARNYGIEMATGKKIFILDADEVLPQKCVYPFMDLVVNPEYDKWPSIFLWLRNIYNKQGHYNQMRQPRIFTNDGTFKYEGHVHHKPVHKEPYFWASDTIWLDHFGYLFKDNQELAKQKFDRSYPMLIENYNNDPHDTYALTHLVKTAKIGEKWEEAIKFGEQWIVEMKLIKERGQYHEGWFAFLEVFIELADVYLRRNDIDNAERVVKEAELFSKRLADLYMIMGYHFIDIDDRKAAEYFEKVVEIVKTDGSAYEQLMTSNIKMNKPRLYNFLSRYYFQNGNRLKSGQYLNMGIQLNAANIPLRWDVYNYKKDAA